jgi:hypothetical protein
VLYSKTDWPTDRRSYHKTQTRVEAGSNTSTVTLRVVGGDEKGSVESETEKYGHESYGSRTRNVLRWRGSACNCKRQTRPLVREGAPTQNTRNCQTINKYLDVTQIGCLIPSQTGWLTVGRNIRLRLTCGLCIIPRVEA